MRWKALAVASGIEVARLAVSGDGSVTARTSERRATSREAAREVSSDTVHIRAGARPDTTQAHIRLGLKPLESADAHIREADEDLTASVAAIRGTDAAEAQQRNAEAERANVSDVAAHPDTADADGAPNATRAVPAAASTSTDGSAASTTGSGLGPAPGEPANASAAAAAAPASAADAAPANGTGPAERPGLAAADRHAGIGVPRLHSVAPLGALAALAETAWGRRAEIREEARKGDGPPVWAVVLGLVAAVFVCLYAYSYYTSRRRDNGTAKLRKDSDPTPHLGGGFAQRLRRQSLTERSTESTGVS